MTTRFTLGIEEEFQMVDRQTGQLVPYVHTALEKGTPLFGDHIKAEMLQSFVELSTGVCSTMEELRRDLHTKTLLLARLLEADGLALIRAGTHPTARWQDQQRTQNARYEVLEEEFQDVARSILIFGLHIHIGLDHHEQAIPLMNQLRNWLPHLLALSANSPFWAGRDSGTRSYRSIVWKRFPRSGVPPIFSSTAEFDAYVTGLIRNGCIDNGKRIWWDIRPHPFFKTIEFRICDMPTSQEDSLAIAALCRTLVAKLTWLYEHNLQIHVSPTYHIDENKWMVARYGLDADIIDFVHNRRLRVRDAIHETLDFVDEVVDDVGCRSEISYLRNRLEDSHGSGADRQLAVYRETGSAEAVTHYLLQQSLANLTGNTLTSEQRLP